MVKELTCCFVVSLHLCSNNTLSGYSLNQYKEKWWSQLKEAQILQSQDRFFDWAREENRGQCQLPSIGQNHRMPFIPSPPPSSQWQYQQQRWHVSPLKVITVALYSIRLDHWDDGTKWMYLLMSVFAWLAITCGWDVTTFLFSSKTQHLSYLTALVQNVYPFQ